MVKTGIWRVPINRFIAGFFFMLISVTSIASPQLVLTTDKTQSELGHPIRVQLYGISLNARLSDINLDSLTSDFGVITDYASGASQDKRWPGQSVQMLQFKLYPRKAGVVTIPSLRIGKIHSQQKALNIIAGETGHPTLRFATETPYQRQEVIIHFTLTTSFSNARLTNKSIFNHNGFEIVPLDFSRTAVSGGKYVLHTGWALTPLTAGMHEIMLPPVEYSISGGSRKLFYPPLKNIRVKKLPAYLPPTIPVGEISISSQVTPGGWLHTDALSYWALQLTAQATDVFSLPPVLRQIKTNSELEILPVTSNRRLQVKQDKVTSLVTHTIPFKSLKSGLLTLPAIHFQYFDPEQGKIKLVTYQSEPVFVLSYFWEMLLAILGMILFIWLAKFTCKKWIHWRALNRKRQLAIQLLQEQGSENNIRKAIRLFCEADTGSANTTLMQWKQYWLNAYQTDENFEDLYNTISNACYSNQRNIDLTALNSDLARLFSNRKRIKIFKFRTI